MAGVCAQDEGWATVSGLKSRESKVFPFQDDECGNWGVGEGVLTSGLSCSRLGEAGKGRDVPVAGGPGSLGETPVVAVAGAPARAEPDLSAWGPCGR